MLKYYASLVVGLLILVGCHNSFSQRNGSNANNVLQGSFWQLANASNFEPDHPPTIMFTDSTTVTGFAGCNHFFGNYAISGDSITFSALGSTRKYCKTYQAAEREFLKFLRGKHAFELRNGLFVLQPNNLKFVPIENSKKGY